jgi:hypothetical protein
VLANLVILPTEAKETFGPETTEKLKKKMWGSFEWHEGDIKIHANPSKSH